jgi:hypothetical protein
MKILILLALTGCSFMTLEQQYDEAVACEGNKEVCEVLWEKYHKREAYQARKEVPKCAIGLVMITDQRRYPSRLGNSFRCITRLPLRVPVTDL